MEVIFLPDAEDDLSYWISTGNKSILKKIAQLIGDIKLHPYTGIVDPSQNHRNNLT